MGYIKKANYKIEEILPYAGMVEYDFDGDLIRMDSLRLVNFKKHGTKCVFCGLEGQYFTKEKFKNDKSYHFNLYSINEYGDEVMLTRDHIIPASQGGEDKLSNLQVGCIRCNNLKYIYNNNLFQNLITILNSEYMFDFYKNYIHYDYNFTKNTVKEYLFNNLTLKGALS